MDFEKFVNDVNSGTAEYREQRRKFLARRQRTRRVLILFPLILAGIFISSAKFYSEGNVYPTPVPPGALVAGGLISVCAFLVASLTSYLQHGAKEIFGIFNSFANFLSRPFGRVLHADDDFDYSLIRKINALAGEVKSLAEAQRTSAEINIEGIKERVTEELLLELSESHLASRGQTAMLKKIDSEFSASKRRLMAEISALGLRGNVNLALGVVTTVVGLVLLAMYVWQMPALTSDPVPFLMSFVPRLSLVLFIQIFSFFFLRLYKSGLSEIKYFQNEITSLELKYLALRASMIASAEDSVSDVVKVLINSERNIILEKGQTTYELEKYKFDQGINGELLKSLPKFWAAAGKRSGEH